MSGSNDAPADDTGEAIGVPRGSTVTFASPRRRSAVRPGLLDSRAASRSPGVVDHPRAKAQYLCACAGSCEVAMPDARDCVGRSGSAAGPRPTRSHSRRQVDQVIGTRRSTRSATSRCPRGETWGCCSAARSTSRRGEPRRVHQASRRGSVVTSDASRWGWPTPRRAGIVRPGQRGFVGKKKRDPRPDGMNTGNVGWSLLPAPYGAIRCGPA